MRIQSPVLIVPNLLEVLKEEVSLVFSDGSLLHRYLHREYEVEERNMLLAKADNYSRVNSWHYD